MADWELRDPLFLLVACVAPAVYWFATRSPSLLVYSSVAVARRTPVTLRARAAKLPGLLLALAALLFAVALAGPRRGDTTSEIHREGIAIALIVDRSGSMQARDFVASDRSIDRLQAVKAIVRDFVAGDGSLGGRPDDLIGLVVFARYADAAAPLTLDHASLLQILDDVEIATEPGEDGTALGEGLALAVERLRRNPAQSKVVILLTDGVTNAGDIDPMAAAELAKSQDVRVYTVGAGRTGFAPVPVTTRDGRVMLQRARVELDEETLVAIAERTGGRYFHAENADALESVYAEIDRLERTEISEVRYMEYTESFPAWILGALACLVAATLLEGTLVRRLP